MTTDQLVVLLEQDRDAGWTELYGSLLSACVAECAAARQDRVEARDIAHDAVTRIAVGGFTTLRDAGNGVPLAAWSRGVARNLVRERVRDRAPRSLVSDPSEPEEDQQRKGLIAKGWGTLDLSSLTDG